MAVSFCTFRILEQRVSSLEEDMGDAKDSYKRVIENCQHYEESFENIFGKHFQRIDKNCQMVFKEATIAHNKLVDIIDEMKIQTACFISDYQKQNELLVKENFDLKQNYRTLLNYQIIIKKENESLKQMVENNKHEIEMLKDDYLNISNQDKINEQNLKFDEILKEIKILKYKNYIDLQDSLKSYDNRLLQQDKDILNLRKESLNHIENYNLIQKLNKDNLQLIDELKHNQDSNSEKFNRELELAKNNCASTLDLALQKRETDILKLQTSTLKNNRFRNNVNKYMESNEEKINNLSKEIFEIKMNTNMQLHSHIEKLNSFDAIFSGKYDDKINDIEKEKVMLNSSLSDLHKDVINLSDKLLKIDNFKQIANNKLSSLKNKHKEIETQITSHVQQLEQQRELEKKDWAMALQDYEVRLQVINEKLSPFNLFNSLNLEAKMLENKDFKIKQIFQLLRHGIPKNLLQENKCRLESRIINKLNVKSCHFVEKKKIKTYVKRKKKRLTSLFKAERQVQSLLDRHNNERLFVNKFCNPSNVFTGSKKYQNVHRKVVKLKLPKF